MLFTEPVDFREALESRAVKAALPTTLKSAELQRLGPDLLERARFAAQVTRVDFLDEFDGLAERFIKGELDLATMRLRLKEFLQRTKYQAPEGKEGTIEDLRSDRRLNLILAMNTQQAQGYGFWQQGQDPAVLEMWPAMELFRAEDRDEPRDWVVRWLGASGEVDDAAAGAALRNHGQMAARKDSAIWTRLGPFKLPYAPFDWNSGMDTRDVPRESAIALGLIKEGDTVPPQRRGFNDLLQASPNVRSQALRDAVLGELGPDYEFDGGVLRRKDKPQRHRDSEEETKVAPKAKPTVQERRPVSEALQIARRSPRPLEDLKKLIDELHDDGVLPRIRVDGNVRTGSAGVYRSNGEGIGVQTRLGDVFTFAHEIGHFLDDEALGDKGSFASEGHADLKPWRDAVRATRIVQQLKEAGEAGENVEYLLRPRELWARSYSQWIAQRIIDDQLGTQEMRDALAFDLRRRMEARHQRGQWTRADFKPVARAIEDLFRKKGWMR